MRKDKKLLCTILFLVILVMNVFLLAGCGRKKKDGNTTLEGTWRLTRLEEYINGSIKQEGDLPIADEINGISIFCQFYTQFKNQKPTSFSYFKIFENEEDKELFEKFKDVPIFMELLNGVVLCLDPKDYSVTENKIKIAENEMTYKIQGKTMTITNETKDESNEHKLILYYKKDVDTVFNNAKHIEELITELDEDNIPEEIVTALDSVEILFELP